MLNDSYQRTIRDLRISVTDFCNYRCTYCKPLHGTPSHEGFHSSASKASSMTEEEILRLTRIFLSLGIEKIRLTGGEPLIRKDIVSLIRQIAPLSGLSDLALTTNGHLLPTLAPALREAGLHRLTVSLDSLRPERFHAITGFHALSRVLEGIEKAASVGFFPLKINAVIVRGINDDELADFARFARETGHIMRFIEFMPLDADKKWSRESVVSEKEMIERLREVHDLQEIGRSYASETASTWRFADGRGDIGIIAPVTRPFCGQCSRLRLTAEGRLRTCLFSERDHDLLAYLRAGASDEGLLERIKAITLLKEPRHRIDQADFQPPARTMSLIGG